MKQRKIAMVVKKFSFCEAEEADDLFWADANENERLNALFDLRLMVFGAATKKKISKVVFKRSLYEESTES
jgi:hypothetical protein